jgi:hypothetical protein
LAAFVLGWTVLAAGPSRASDQKLAGVWMEGNRLTLRVQQDVDIRPAAHEALRIALNDPDAAVRERARELVLDWHIALDGA